jgi:hypothetical protein
VGDNDWRETVISYTCTVVRARRPAFTSGSDSRRSTGALAHASNTIKQTKFLYIIGVRNSSVSDGTVMMDGEEQSSLNLRPSRFRQSRLRPCWKGGLHEVQAKLIGKVDPEALADSHLSCLRRVLALLSALLQDIFLCLSLRHA